MNQFRHIANRIASMLGVGRVTAMQDDGGTQSVQYQTRSRSPAPTGWPNLGFPPGFPLVPMSCWRSWEVIVRIR